jgi:DNA-binding NarL/FixJ family response regulator
MSGIIRVLLVDGDVATRNELKQMLSSEEGIMVIGEVSGEKSELAKAKQLSPDITIVLAGYGMSYEKSVNSACAISEANLPAKVIIMAEDPLKYLAPAIKAGAAGLLSDSIGRNELLSTIRRIHLWFPGSLSSGSTQPKRDSTL